MAESDEHYMQLALKEAGKAFDQQEVPVGAVIVIHDKVIARGYNQVEKLNDSTAHAEIIALTSAYNFLGSKYLPGAILYVTVEPCLMCAGALYWSRIGKVVYGTADEKHGALSRFRGVEITPASYDKANLALSKSFGVLHPKTKVTGNICSDECAALMKQFFRAKR